MYDESLLNILFQSKPKIIDQEAGIFEYTITNAWGFIFKLYFIACEGFVVVKMEFKNELLYEVSIKNVIEIKAERDELKIFKEGDQGPVVAVTINQNAIIYSTSFLSTRLKLPVLELAEPIQNHPILTDDFGLMVLFYNEPLIINQEKKILEYRIQDASGFKLTLWFSSHEQEIKVKLSYKDKIVYEIAIDQVIEIKTENEKLIFFKECSYEPIVQITVMPSFASDQSLFTLDANL